EIASELEVVIKIEVPIDPIAVKDSRMTTAGHKWSIEEKIGHRTSTELSRVLQLSCLSIAGNVSELNADKLPSKAETMLSPRISQIVHKMIVVVSSNDAVLKGESERAQTLQRYRGSPIAQRIGV